MKRVILASAIAVSGFFVVPAHAKVGDAAWAACVWEKSPRSAQKWLGMATPVWMTDTQAPNAALALRLAAICATEPANEMKPNRDFNWKQMASTLRRAQGTNAAISDPSSPVVKMCRNNVTKDEKTELFRIDIIREEEKRQLLVFQQYFASLDGKALKLPQDLRSVPTENDGKLSVDCKVISGDGTLIDA